MLWGSFNQSLQNIRLTAWMPIVNLTSTCFFSISVRADSKIFTIWRMGIGVGSQQTLMKTENSLLLFQFQKHLTTSIFIILVLGNEFWFQNFLQVALINIFVTAIFFIFFVFVALLTGLNFKNIFKIKETNKFDNYKYLANPLI